MALWFKLATVASRACPELSFISTVVGHHEVNRSTRSNDSCRILTGPAAGGRINLCKIDVGRARAWNLTEVNIEFKLATEILISPMIADAVGSILRQKGAVVKAHVHSSRRSCKNSIIEAFDVDSFIQALFTTCKALPSGRLGVRLGVRLRIWRRVVTAIIRARSYIVCFRVWVIPIVVAMRWPIWI